MARSPCRQGSFSVTPACASASGDRLQGFWSMACGQLVGLPRAPDPLASTPALARAVRAQRTVMEMTQQKSNWWTTQLGIECNELFNAAALEPYLLQRAPTAWGVVKTVALMSPRSTS